MMKWRLNERRVINPEPGDYLIRYVIYGEYEYHAVQFVDTDPVYQWKNDDVWLDDAFVTHYMLIEEPS